MRTLLQSAVVVTVALLIVSVAVGAESKKPENPRDLFRALGVGDGYFARLANGTPVDAEETEALMRILFRLRIFPPADVEHWALGQDDVAKAVAQPDKFQGSIFRLRGEVVAVEPIKSTGDAATRYELPNYFRCILQLESPKIVAEVYAENVPSAWQKGEKPGVPGGAMAAFLKLGPKNMRDGTSRPVFAATRMAWYPDNLLGRLGMDIGLFSDVQDRKSLLAEETDAFYSMLAAVGRAKPGELTAQAEANLPRLSKEERWTDQNGQVQYSVVPLFNAPAATQRGRLVVLSGTARRVEEIRVDDPEITARFGITHYYQISLFTDDSFDDKGNRNPVTFCVLELPKGMPVSKNPRYGESVRIAGYFFKTWKYRVPVLADPRLQPDPKTHHQLSPLLIGRSVTWYPAATSIVSTGLTAIVILLVCLFVVIAWSSAWRTRKHEKLLMEETIIAPSEKLDFSGDIEVSDRPHRPDFSRLTTRDTDPVETSLSQFSSPEEHE